MPGIKSQMMIIILVVSLSSALLIGYFGVTTGQTVIEEQVENQLKSAAQSRAEHLKTFLDEHKQTVELISSSFVFKDILKMDSGDPKYTEKLEETNKNFESLLKSHPEFYEVFILDKNGIIVTTTNNENIGLDRSTDPYFINGKEGTYIKDAYYSETSQKKSIAISSPILDEKTNEVLGILVAGIETKELDRIMLDRTGLGETGEVYLVNRDYLMITPSRFEEDTFLKKRVDTENVRNCFLHSEYSGSSEEVKEISIFQDYRGVPVLGTNEYIPEMQWGLLVEIDASEAFAVISQMKLEMALISILFSLLISLVSVLLVDRFTRPIRQIEEGIEIIGNGDLDYHLDIKAGDEIGKVAESVNQMTLKLKKSQDELQNCSATLEDKVAEGTAEIEKKIIEVDSQRTATMNVLRDIDETKAQLENFSKELEGSNMSLSEEISERKRVEGELHTSENRLSSFMDSAFDGFLIFDKNLNIISINNAAEGMLKFTKGDIGKNILEIAPHLEGSEGLMQYQEVVRTGTHFSTKDIIPGGQYGNVHLNVKAFRVGKGMGIVLNDVTEQVKAESRLRETAEDLEATNEELIDSRVELESSYNELQKSKEEQIRLNEEITEKNKELEQVVYVASHDLRSPLVNVQGFSKELVYSIKELESALQTEEISPEVKEKITHIFEEDIPDAINFISSSISKMDSLLHGLLRISRLGHAALNFEDLDMNVLLSDIEKATEFRIKEARVDLEIDELPPCFGDSVQINQVFSNLIDNSLKYHDLERGGIIKITGERKDGKVIYCIEDNGIGIPKEHQKKIFEIFHRLDPEGTQGEGLGLTLVSKILSRHNGGIWVESERGAGAKFFISMPATEDENAGGENHE